METKTLIGSAEKVGFPEQGLRKVPARIDTGAKTSTIWASNIRIEKKKLTCTFFDKTSNLYTDKHLTFDEFDRIAVTSSNGQVQKRFKVKLVVRLKGRKVRAWFTLADRSTQVYPVLIGRNVLSGKFIVDVKKGRTLKKEERQRTAGLLTQLDSPEEEQ